MILRRGLLALLLLLPALPVAAQERFLVLASTTSTEQSGLFAHLLPAFTAATGIGVRVVALGTGQALDVGRRGDADALLVHDRPAEEAFVAEGLGVGPRHAVMYNDFVLIGPAADPAGIAGLRRRRRGAAGRIAAAGAPFVSRGDQSAAPMRPSCALWKHGRHRPAAGRRRAGTARSARAWAPALDMAAATQEAYVLTDRGTWLAFRNRRRSRQSWSRATSACSTSMA